ncbi:hypothetical protein CYMTET_23686, partial [Cymbomonas tetramitiformis]
MKASSFAATSLSENLFDESVNRRVHALSPAGGPPSTHTKQSLQAAGLPPRAPVGTKINKPPPQDNPHDVLTISSSATLSAPPEDVFERATFTSAYDAAYEGAYRGAYEGSYDSVYDSVYDQSSSLGFFLKDVKTSSRGTRQPKEQLLLHSTGVDSGRAKGLDDPEHLRGMAGRPSQASGAEKEGSLHTVNITLGGQDASVSLRSLQQSAAEVNVTDVSLPYLAEDARQLHTIHASQTPSPRTDDGFVAVARADARPEELRSQPQGVHYGQQREEHQLAPSQQRSHTFQKPASHLPSRHFPQQGPVPQQPQRQPVLVPPQPMQPQQWQVQQQYGQGRGVQQQQPPLPEQPQSAMQTPHWQGQPQIQQGQPQIQQGQPQIQQGQPQIQQGQPQIQLGQGMQQQRLQQQRLHAPPSPIQTPQWQDQQQQQQGQALQQQQEQQQQQQLMQNSQWPDQQLYEQGQGQHLHPPPLMQTPQDPLQGRDGPGGHQGHDTQLPRRQVPVQPQHSTLPYRQQPNLYHPTNSSQPELGSAPSGQHQPSQHDPWLEHNPPPMPHLSLQQHLPPSSPAHRETPDAPRERPAGFHTSQRQLFLPSTEPAPTLPSPSLHRAPPPTHPPLPPVPPAAHQAEPGASMDPYPAGRERESPSRHEPSPLHSSPRTSQLHHPSQQHQEPREQRPRRQSHDLQSDRESASSDGYGGDDPQLQAQAQAQARGRSSHSSTMGRPPKGVERRPAASTQPSASARGSVDHLPISPSSTDSDSTLYDSPPPGSASERDLPLRPRIDVPKPQPGRALDHVMAATRRKAPNGAPSRAPAYPKHSAADVEPTSLLHPPAGSSTAASPGQPYPHDIAPNSFATPKRGYTVTQPDPPRPATAPPRTPPPLVPQIDDTEWAEVQHIFRTASPR